MKAVSVNRAGQVGVCSLCSQALLRGVDLQRPTLEPVHAAHRSQAGPSTSYAASGWPRQPSERTVSAFCGNVEGTRSSFFGEKVDSHWQYKHNRSTCLPLPGVVAVAAPERPGLYSNGREPQRETVVVDPENGRRTVLSESQDGTARVKVGVRRYVGLLALSWHQICTELAVC
jgi:hypothetical protein